MRTHILYLALIIVSLAAYSAAISSPCGYCKYCAYCGECKNCPCNAAQNPNCEMCKYCPYCKICDTVCPSCEEGGILNTVSNWVDSFTSAVGLAPDTVSDDQIKRDLAKARLKPIPPKEKKQEL